MVPVSDTMKAIRWHPPSYDVRVETIPTPTLQDPDDAIVKVKYAGLCGSDLHIYRGHGDIQRVHTIGHEFLGEVVALGSNYGKDVRGRPQLYSSLKVGDRVIAPFTVNCGECHICRLGYTGRCPNGLLFGSTALDGGQAQYVRVPKAGGSLFNLSDPSTWSTTLTKEEQEKALTGLSDASLLLLADILPTGVFAALQAINHPKVQPLISGRSWPLCFMPPNQEIGVSELALTPEDRLLTFAIVGLGPVGVCAAIALLDLLAIRGLPFRIVAIDPNASRREKMKHVYNAIALSGRGSGEFEVRDIEEAKVLVKSWTNNSGCTAVLEVVGNNSALTLSYDLVRAYGVIVSVGVHGEPPVPFNGRQVYGKSVSFDFGRCPARAMFPMAFDLLVKRQDVLGGLGESASLLDKIVSFEETPRIYDAFDKGKIGKVIFDPWK